MPQILEKKLAILINDYLPITNSKKNKKEHLLFETGTLLNLLSKT